MKRRVMVGLLSCCATLVVWSILSVNVLTKEESVARANDPLTPLRQRGSTSAVLGATPPLTKHETDISRQRLNLTLPRTTPMLQHHSLDAIGALSLDCAAATGIGGVASARYAKLLNALSGYISYHRQHSSERALVWVCTKVDWCGGLADRLKGIAYSLLLAIFTDRKLLLLWNTPERTFLGHNALNWSTKAHGVPEYGMQLSLYGTTQGYGIDKDPSLAKKILQYIYSPQKVVYFSTNLEPRDLRNRNKTLGLEFIFRGLESLGLNTFTDEEMDRLVGIMFRYLFTVDKEFMSTFRAVKKSLGLEGIRYVGVHLRTGFAGMSHEESVNHPKLLRQTSQWDKVLQCAILTANQLLGQESYIYVSSDSSLGKELARSRYRHRVKARNVPLGHLDKLSKNATSTAGLNEGDVVAAMWTDLFLLAGSYAVVGSDSGFFALALHLCGIPYNRTFHGLHCSLV